MAQIVFSSAVICYKSQVHSVRIIK